MKPDMITVVQGYVSKTRRMYSGGCPPLGLLPPKNTAYA